MLKMLAKSERQLILQLPENRITINYFHSVSLTKLTQFRLRSSLSLLESLPSNLLFIYIHIQFEELSEVGIERDLRSQLAPSHL